MSSIVLLYRPDLGRVLKELNFCYPAEGAIWLEQMSYWYKKKMGYIMRDGKRYIYNSYKDWTQSQIATLSQWQLGKMMRQLEEWGWIVKKNFAQLRSEFINPDLIPEEFHPYNTTSWVALNIEAITSLIGWNPFDPSSDTALKDRPAVQGRDAELDNPQPEQDNKVESNNLANVNSPDCALTRPRSSEPSPHTDLASATMGDAIPNSASLHSQSRSIYKDYSTITKSIGEDDLKIEGVRQQVEADNSVRSVGVAAPKGLGDRSQVASSSHSVEAESNGKKTTPLAFETEVENEGTKEGLSIESDEEINNAQEYLAALNVELDRQEQKVPPKRPPSHSIQIAGLDEEITEEVHQILGKHQDRLGELNVDLNAERVCRAIADNPQHLEDAIYALYENSANGAKTQEMATGFFYNALRHGWKPRHSHHTSARSLPVYVPDRAWVLPLPPPTLEELVERKRSLWQNAPIMRPSVEAWVMQTDGVAMSEDGPVLVDGYSRHSGINLAKLP